MNDLNWTLQKMHLRKTVKVNQKKKEEENTNQIHIPHSII